MRFVLLTLFTVSAFGQVVNEHWDASSDTYTISADASAVRIGPFTAGSAYSGEVIRQVTRTLADGTHLSSPPNVMKLWRDSQGRSRSENIKPGPEHADRPGRFHITQISDPVARAIYIFDDDAKTVYRFAETAGPREPHVDKPQPGSVVTVKLGSRSFEGVAAQGTREIRTIALGEIGNDKPVVTTSDEWYSPELHRPVLGLWSDPRTGEISTRLTGIKRAEPDASLFRPPSDYAMVDATGVVHIVLRRR